MSFLFRLFVPFLLCLTVAACDTEPVPDAVMQPSYIRLSPVAPPDTPEEVAPQPDSPQTEIWRPGYWSYDSGSFDWVAGEMMPRPSPTAVWSGDHWLQHDYGWAFVPGYWQ